MRIGPRYFEQAARRSARNALIRNAVFLLVLLGGMALLTTTEAPTPERAGERQWVLGVEGFLALFTT